MHRRVIKIFLLAGVCGLGFGLGSNTAESYRPKDFSTKIVTSGVPGGKAYIKANLKAPPEEIWKSLLETNTMADKYPRMKRAFCIEEEDVEASKKDGLRNGATVDRRYKEKMCEPREERKNGEKWTYFLFQEIDYPFPLSDRWMMSEVANDETEAKKNTFKQVGTLIYGRQPIYEFRIDITPNPKNPKETNFNMYIHSDPGGFIADWMIRTATEYIAPKYMEILEGMTRQRLGLPNLVETESRWQ